MFTILIQITEASIFFFVLSSMSYLLCRRWFSTASVTVRLTATFVVLAWILSIGFAILMTLKIFTAWAAVVFAIVVIIISHRLIWPPGKLFVGLKSDLILIRNAIADTGRDMGWWAILGCFLLLCTLMAIRSICLPLMGWDSLTYHAVKAGLWVQKGTWSILNAPGGWEYYRSFFGGGEIFTAWAQLFFRSDFLAAVPDFCFWLLMGLSIICLARKCGLERRHAVLISLAIICAPVFTRSVGSGYVDTCGNALLLCGFYFFLRSLHSHESYNLYIAAASLGIASSVKVNILATVILISLPFLVILIAKGKWHIRIWFYCALLYLLPVTTWFLYNYTITGYPLGCTPLSLGPITLGKAPPNLAWFLNRPDLRPYKISSELNALLHALTIYGPCLLLSVLGIPGLLRGVWHRSSIHLLGVALMLSSALLFFSPSFSVIRLVWPGTIGRFIVPIIVLPSVMGLSVIAKNKTGRALFEAISMVCVITGVYEYIRSHILNRSHVELFFIGVAIILIVCGYWVLKAPKIRRTVKTRLGILSITIVYIMITIAGIKFKDWIRLYAYSNCTTMHDFPRYWVPALKALDAEEPPLCIAFTYGPLQISHYAFLAPFLGARLENRLVYVSPEKNGNVLPHHPDSQEKSNPDFDNWMNTLVDTGATHLLCFRPPSIELEWAETHPCLFIKLAGVTDDWGLFRIVPSDDSINKLKRSPKIVNN